NVGTVFKMTLGGSLVWSAPFANTNGANPSARLLPGVDGNFYGTTEFGGATNYGGVFQVTPAGNLNLIFSFNFFNGNFPLAGLTAGADGRFYGTTHDGSGIGGGVFRLGFPMSPVFRSITESGGVTTLTWTAMTGQSYQLLHTAGLMPASWVNLG